MRQSPLLPTSVLQLLLLSTTQPLFAHSSDVVHPAVVRKMSLEEGEKLMPEYIAFSAPRNSSPLIAPVDAASLDSRGFSPAFEPPFGTHLISRSNNSRSGKYGQAIEARKAADAAQRDVLVRLQGRQFSCPENTSACTNIGQSNYCCASGTTCFTVDGAPDSGNVGCCPNGQTCAGSVGQCTGGSTACAAEQGGGCCIPGYVCANVGCIPSWVSLITQTTVTSTVVNQPTPTTVVQTVIVTVTPIVEPTTITTTSTKTGSAPEQSTATETATEDEPSTTTRPPGSTTYASAIPPVQPTGAADYCPTGFYACLAVDAGGGCCRTGRDCATTSCPPPPQMTTITQNGVTVVVPLSDAQAAAQPTSTCAGGWFMCGKEAGPIAGCCPSGYECGTASCTLVSGTPVATVIKELPSSGKALRELCGSVMGAAAGLVLGVMLVVV